MNIIILDKPFVNGIFIALGNAKGNKNRRTMRKIKMLRVLSPKRNANFEELKHQEVSNISKLHVSTAIITGEKELLSIEISS